jgi:hypothetical protein
MLTSSSFYYVTSSFECQFYVTLAFDGEIAFLVTPVVSKTKGQNKKEPAILLNCSRVTVHQ